MTLHEVMPISSFVEIALALVAASASYLRLWLWLRRSMIAERSRTQRLSEALRNVDGHERAEVVRACAELESSIGTAE
jgi:hypothetical protein